MAIRVSSGKMHWNYFLALERDFEVISRYVEFSEKNFGVFSIELAHLLLTAASEVDVVAKLICKHVEPDSRRRNIADYKKILLRAVPELPEVTINVPRYGWSSEPWENWRGSTNPDWWGSYNHVKHERDSGFEEASLGNAANALGGLMILVYHYYARVLSPDGVSILCPQETTALLEPGSTFLRFDEEYYYTQIVT